MNPPPYLFDVESLWTHRRFMRTLALDLVGDEHRADDVVQQAWMAALEKPPQTVEKTRAWLAAVVRNLARRSVGRELRRRDIEDDFARRADAGDNAAERDFELQNELASALHALPEPYKSTVHQRYFMDLSPSEIAIRGKLSVDTVKTRLKRGLELLRSDLDLRHRGERALWCVPLTCLIQRLPETATKAALGSTALLGGILTMKALGIILLSATGIAAIMFAFRATQDEAALGPSASLASGGTQVELESTAVAESPAETEKSERVGLESAPEITPPAATVESTALVEIVDQNGDALAGVRVAFDDQKGREWMSDATGRARIDWPRDALTERTLSFAKPDYLSLTRAVEIADELGRFVLVRGATVSGLILDANGVGVSGANVIVAEPGMRFFESVAILAQRYSTQSTQADALGRFRLSGVPAGMVRVWGGADGFVDGSSSAFAVRAATEVADVEVTLAAAATADEIAGRVVLPPDTESADVEVWYHYVSDEGGRTRRAPVDENGRFRIRVEQREPHDLWAREVARGWDERLHLFTGESELELWRGEVASDVAPGTSNLVLRFEKAPVIDITVTDENGSRLRSCELRVVEFSGNDLSQQIPWQREVALPLQLAVPAAGFYIAATADGFSRDSRGPLDPASAPESLNFELKALPLVTGRVTADGEPLEGARIELIRGVASKYRVLSGGFQLRMSSALSVAAVSILGGEYELTVRERGEYYVLASAQGWATAELGPLDIDPEEGIEDLDLELTRGGSIEGRLLLPPGTDSTGFLVGASRGDPHSQILAVGADGHFRFDRLTPGRWRIQHVKQAGGASSISSSRSPVTWSGNCDVVDGETTHFDLDLASAETCVLQGQLVVADESVEDASAELRVNAGPLGDGERIDKASLASDGSFELIADEPGTYRMIVRTDSIIVLRVLKVEEPKVEWSERIELGELTGTIDWSELPDPTMLVWIAGEGNSLTAARLQPDDLGGFTASVPVGEGHVHYATPEMMEDVAPPDWPVLGRATVEAGETTTFSVE